MKHILKHDVSVELAKKALDKAMDTYREKFPSYNPKGRWVSDTRLEIEFASRGFTIQGSVDVAPKEVAFELEVPFLLRPFKSQAIGVIEREFVKWSEVAKSGQLD